MNSDDEALENCIEENWSESESESDKENCSRTKPEQIKKIMSFVAENTGKIEKKVYSSMWDRLSEELNDIGPPKHTTKKWKRIWTVYKYNNKKRLPEKIRSESRPQQDDQTRVLVPKEANKPHKCLKPENLMESELKMAENSDKSGAEALTDNATDPSSQTDVHPVELLSLVLHQQKIIINKLDKHEHLLNEIVKKK